MIKKSYPSVRLDCIMQTEELNSESCPMGVMSFNPEDSTFRFEEATKRHRPSRNLKLYEGDYVSIVHMQNGKYQVHMRNIDASGCPDRKDLAFKVYNELLNAFTIID